MAPITSSSKNEPASLSSIRSSFSFNTSCRSLLVKMTGDDGSDALLNSLLCSVSLTVLLNSLFCSVDSNMSSFSFVGPNALDSSFCSVGPDALDSSFRSAGPDVLLDSSFCFVGPDSSFRSVGPDVLLDSSFCSADPDVLLG